MTGWSTKRFAAYALMGVLGGLCGGFQLACHKHHETENFTNRPQLSYQTPVILATAGAPFASVAPDVSAFVVTNGVGSLVTTGFSFTVQPNLPAGLTLGPTTGIISGTPAAPATPADRVITASNSAGSTTFTISVGVQASSPVAMDYAGTGAASVAVDGAVFLKPPVVTGGAPTGFGVSPALPAGLDLNGDTGLVSGSPTNTGSNPSGNYLLTVTTANGSANAPFILLVAPALPLLGTPGPLAYPAGAGTLNPLVLTLNTPMSPLTPTPAVTGTAVVFTVLPALPAGLGLDPLTGAISGTPTAAAPQAAYTITASNPGGNSPTQLFLAVQ